MVDWGAGFTALLQITVQLGVGDGIVRDLGCGQLGTAGTTGGIV